MHLAYCYIRVSGIGQIDGDGPERQEQAINTFSTLNGYELAELFIEPITGKTDLEGRTVFQRMRSLLVSGPVKTVIIEKLDRLARDVMVQEQFIADMQRHGITLLSTSLSEADLCSTDPGRVLVRQIMGSFAQYERAMIVSRTRAARQRIKSNHFWAEGVAPYGYAIEGRKGEKRLVVDNQEQGVIEHIRGARNGGLGLENIASQLNTLGIKPRRGKRWYPAQVSRILSRPTMSLP